MIDPRKQMTDFRKALADLVVAVGNHPDAMMATGDLHTPFMRACAALESSAAPEVARSGETPRTDAILADLYGGASPLTTPKITMIEHARQLERELAGLAAMYRASVKMVEETIPSPPRQKD